MFKILISVCGVKIGKQDITIDQIISPDEMHLGTRLKMDSHTDTRWDSKHTSIGSIVEGTRVDAVPFDESIGKLSDLLIINAMNAYEKTNTFCTILLQIKHAIYIKDIKYALMCPNQDLKNGTIIDDIPPPLDSKVTVTFTIIDIDHNFLL